MPLEKSLQISYQIITNLLIMCPYTTAIGEKIHISYQIVTKLLKTINSKKEFFKRDKQ